MLYSTSSTSLAILCPPGLLSTWNTRWAGNSGHNGYVLYPGTQVVSVYANGAVGNVFTLMPNTVPWANGDIVELPQHPSNYVQLGTWNVRSWWPTAGAVGPRLDFTGVQGANTTAMRIYN